VRHGWRLCVSARGGAPRGRHRGGTTGRRCRSGADQSTAPTGNGHDVDDDLVDHDDAVPDTEHAAAADHHNRTAHHHYDYNSAAHEHHDHNDNDDGPAADDYSAHDSAGDNLNDDDCHDHDDHDHDHDHHHYDDHDAARTS
jgi:hypothetical protein